MSNLNPCPTLTPLLPSTDFSHTIHRFAPSPTGTLHVGGARTALFNWLAARRSDGGAFIVRVEDTDEARSSRASEASILADLKWLGLQWDEGPDVGGPFGPYRQSERKDMYAEYAERLVAEGKAYYCFCTDEDVAAMKEEAIREGRMNQYNGRWRNASPAEVQRKLVQGESYTVRFKIPEECTVRIKDAVRGVVVWDANAALGDFILMRSSGMPVYNFCVAVDDLCMEITHVIRAEEHLSNTLRQVLLFHAFDRPHPVYAHCSLILAADRSKLSKRHGATSVNEFKEAGYLPAGMINYLANLGWNDGSTQEIYTVEELVKCFSIDRVVRSAAVFDVDKLNWVNGHHIKNLPSRELSDILQTVLEADNALLCPVSNLQPLHRDNREKFMQLVTAIGQPLISVTKEIHGIVTSILDYPFIETVNLADLPLSGDEDVDNVAELSHSERKKSLQADAAVVRHMLANDFLPFVAIVLNDIEENNIPTEVTSDSPEVWKKYVASLSAKSKRKGKTLLHPLRLVLTGRLSGSDVGLQLQMVQASEGLLVAGAAMSTVSLRERAVVLRKYLESAAPHLLQ
jgi:glutamyl-tRNA synthetase